MIRMVRCLNQPPISIVLYHEVRRFFLTKIDRNRKTLNFAPNLKQSNMYPAELVAPMANELNQIGFESLNTPEEVVEVMENAQGTTLVMVNSVCGCAARNARPGVRYALDNEKTPDRLVTVFAGVDMEATAKAREFMLPYPPSSPSVALFKDGKLVHFLERHHIEGRPAEIIAQNLKMAFDRYC